MMTLNTSCNRSCPTTASIARRLGSSYSCRAGRPRRVLVLFPDNNNNNNNNSSSMPHLSLLSAVLLLLFATAVHADLANERHFVSPRVPAVPDATGVHENNGSASSKTWALLQSPCQPEADGYFGATYGEPFVLQYALELVWRNNYNIDNDNHENDDKEAALDLIRERVMDAVVSDTFPTLCALPRNRRRRDLTFAAEQQQTADAASWSSNNTPLLGKITGFQFGDNLDVDPGKMCLSSTTKAFASYATATTVRMSTGDADSSTSAGFENSSSATTTTTSNNHNNECQIYTAALQIFGHDVTLEETERVLLAIVEALTNDSNKDNYDELFAVRLFQRGVAYLAAAPAYSRLVHVPTGWQQQSQTVSLPAWIGLTVFVLCMCFGLAVLVRYMMLEQQQQRQAQQQQWMATTKQQQWYMSTTGEGNRRQHQPFPDSPAQQHRPPEVPGFWSVMLGHPSTTAGNSGESTTQASTGVYSGLALFNGKRVSSCWQWLSSGFRKNSGNDRNASSQSNSSSCSSSRGTLWGMEILDEQDDLYYYDPDDPYIVEPDEQDTRSSLSYFGDDRTNDCDGDEHGSLTDDYNEDNDDEEYSALYQEAEEGDNDREDPLKFPPLY